MDPPFCYQQSHLQNITSHCWCLEMCKISTSSRSTFTSIYQIWGVPICQWKKIKWIKDQFSCFLSHFIWFSICISIKGNLPTYLTCLAIWVRTHHLKDFHTTTLNQVYCIIYLQSIYLTIIRSKYRSKYIYIKLWRLFFKN